MNFDGDHHTYESPSPTLSNCHRNGVPGNHNPAKGALTMSRTCKWLCVNSATGLRSDLLAAMENADRAPGPDPICIPSERYGGEIGVDGKRERKSCSHFTLDKRFICILFPARASSVNRRRSSTVAAATHTHTMHSLPRFHPLPRPLLSLPRTPPSFAQPNKLARSLVAPRISCS